MLVGTTASGKSEAAWRVASARPDVEIVAVDSMTVYRGLDLATAKPTAVQRATVRHHLLDLVDPADEFTVSMFQEAARDALADIERRAARALLVGGTGLYVRAVVDDLALPGRYPELATSLEAESERPTGAVALHGRLAELDPVAASRMAPENRRRVVRALEVTIGSGRPFSSYGPGLEAYPPTRFVQVGIPFDASRVDRRIAERIVGWLDAGLLEEVRALAERPAGLSRTARQALGYKELLAHLEGACSLDEALERIVQRTRAFARRQWSWFRRDPRIAWLGPDEDPAGVVGALLDGSERSAARDRARD